MKKLQTQSIAPYIFISPFFILFAVFGIFPIGYSIVMSFFNWKLTGPVGFIGFQNYINVLTVDPYFVKAIGNTVVLLITGSLLQHFIALPLAIMVNSKIVKQKEWLFSKSYG